MKMRIGIIVGICLFCVAAASQTVTSPNMGLPIPVPGVTPAPQWAQAINASLTAIDSHNHSPGQGVQISPNGMDINSDLSFGSNDATQLRSARFSVQSTPITASSPDIGIVYVSGNELYYNDVTGGNQVKITTNGAVNAGAGSITGLPSGTASASYAAGVFTFQSATNTAATVDGRNFVLRNSTATSKGLTLMPPAAMASDIQETLPTIPAGTSFMTMDSSGNMATTISTTGGITNSMIANTTITGAKIANGTITGAKLASGLTQFQDFTTGGSTAFVVPANVTWVQIEMCAGGGGGAGGGAATINGQGGGGGAGNGSLLSTPYVFLTTPGETLTVVVGAGGAGGAGGTAGGTGVSGAFGGASEVDRGPTILFRLQNFNQAIGGNGGNFGLGGAGGAGGISIDGAFTTGGNGGDNVSPPAQNGTSSFIWGRSGGTGGTTGGGGGAGGGGGGGASSFAAGGNGGNGGSASGATSPTAGSNAAGNCSGGGGGGGGGGATGAGAAGGGGGAGYVRISWVALP